MSQIILPEILQEFLDKLKTLFTFSDINHKKSMPIKIQTRENNTIITCNIFLNEGGYLEDLFQKITEVFENTLEKINGEIIHYELTKGKILDTGIQEFQIDLAKVWDIYLYDPEIFIYVRLLVESKLAQPKNSWISLDIDVITNSAWFL